MNKHDDACLRRKEVNPFLCTCDLSDEDVRAHEAHLLGFNKHPQAAPVCTCGVKTPQREWHAWTCPYRM